MTNHVVLYEPLMPANTGNIARTCAGTNTVLDLIEPLGFQIDNKKMKRAGLDYWDKVAVHMHDDLNAFLKTLGPDDEMYLISKFSSKNYSQVETLSFYYGSKHNEQEHKHALKTCEKLGLKNTRIDLDFMNKSCWCSNNFRRESDILFKEPKAIFVLLFVFVIAPNF